MTENKNLIQTELLKDQTLKRIEAIKNGVPNQYLDINTLMPEVKKKINIVGVITKLFEIRTVTTIDGSTLSVRNATLTDNTGSVDITFWDGDTLKYQIGDIIAINNGYSKVYQEKPNISSGYYGSIVKFK